VLTVDAKQPDARLFSMLEFVGRVTASATHEIKNELAVINEQSRLLQEMLAMARQGREVDPARMEQLIGRVVARVGQADQAVRRLNAFAHTADLERTSTNLEEILAALLRFFERIASLKGVALEFDAGQTHGDMPIRPILLEQAVWTCLDIAVRQAEKGSKLRMSPKREEDELKVVFSLEPPMDLEAPEAELLCLSGAELAKTADGKMVLQTRGNG
jgi:signal transduction histidine kinase